MALQTTKELEDLTVETDGWPTTSTIDQAQVERACEAFLLPFKAKSKPPSSIILDRAAHVGYLKSGLKQLGSGYSSLDASRPWLIYWILHSLELLGVALTSQEENSVITTLELCQSPTARILYFDAGGFGGGPGQVAHLAPTYASVNALAIVGKEKAFSVINRTTLLAWMMTLRTPEGGFLMHLDGELDVRGAYCAASVAKLLNIAVPELFAGTPAWVAKCQTFDGGVAAVPGAEAHGGYAFCGLAALVLLEQQQLLDLGKLAYWACSRQMRLEGGFQGRPNKLVDGCYSFWEYVLLCAQAANGGLRDKPGKNRDYYHTCYCLSGLSSAQHGLSNNGEEPFVHHPSNLLEPTHPMHNILPWKVDHIKAYFPPFKNLNGI